MELKDQVCSLELAKRLKALGVKQESAFYLEDQPTGLDPVLLRSEVANPDDADTYAAFTVAELGEILRGYDLWAAHLDDEEALVRSWIEFIKQKEKTKKEADSRATFAIFLIEGGILIPTTEPHP